MQPTQQQAPTDTTTRIPIKSVSDPVIKKFNPPPLPVVLDKPVPIPEMETIEVELVKDQQGLGITIAGYVCEKGACVCNVANNN